MKLDNSSLLHRNRITRAGLMRYVRMWGQSSGDSVKDYAMGITPTAIGTTWGPKGRTFDGSDDKISIPLTHPTTAGTHAIWFKPAALEAVNPNALTMWTDPTFATWHWSIQLNAAGTIGGYWYTDAAKNTTSNTVCSVGTWYFAAITAANNSNGIVYVNGKAEGTPVALGTLYSDASMDRLCLSFIHANRPAFDGIIGEVSVYNRALSAGEIMHNYNATKWRYV